MRILFMGGHELGKITLKQLVQNGKEIVGAVITDTDNDWYKGVDEIADFYKIPLFKVKDINELNFINKVRDINPELIVVVNFEQILKEEIITIPTFGCINTHASLLPKYRGRAPLNWAIINGERETGVTVHYIEKGIDTGDIITQKRIRINKNDYIGDLLEKVKLIYPDIVNDAIDKISNNSAKPIKQDNSKSFYLGKRSAEDGLINWDKPAAEIFNLIRAVSKPYPGAFTYYKKQKVTIWSAKLINQSEKHRKIVNGTILKVNNNSITVKAEGKNVVLLDIEPLNLIFEPYLRLLRTVD